MSYLVGYRYLWLDKAGVPHTEPIVQYGGNSYKSHLPILKLMKGEVIVEATATAAVVAPDGYCWAWRYKDPGEWKSVEEAVAALRKQMGKSTPKLVPEQEPESAE